MTCFIKGLFRVWFRGTFDFKAFYYPVINKTEKVSKSLVALFGVFYDNRKECSASWDLGNPSLPTSVRLLFGHPTSAGATFGERPAIKAAMRGNATTGSDFSISQHLRCLH
jgi:hypothetical protein